MVNLEFEDWLQKEVCKEHGLETFDALCKKLGLSTIACLKQATEAFEEIKQHFSTPQADPQFITLRGPHGANMRRWEKEITRLVLRNH